MKTKRAFKRALITGITGSGGSYLADYIIEHHPEVEVHGVARWHSTSKATNLKRAGAKAKVHECDLSDMSSVFTTLQAVNPDVIFHIAAHANVRASFTTPLSVLQNNIMGTANLFEGLRLLKMEPLVQLCSTSEVYGQVDPKFVPINEETPLNPSSPYAVSKVTQDLLGYTYFRCYGMPIVRTRMFTYINPRRGDLFATAFATQVARIEAGLQDELLHGNLDSVRTIIDVRDAMEAYWMAATLCEAGEAYNIGGNTKTTVGAFLDLLKQHAKVPLKTRQDPALLRPADVTLQVPDCRKFAEATGWAPKYDFADSVAYLLESCRAAVRGEVALKS